jgi:hypothetical protein
MALNPGLAQRRSALGYCLAAPSGAPESAADAKRVGTSFPGMMIILSQKSAYASIFLGGARAGQMGSAGPLRPRAIGIGHPDLSGNGDWEFYRRPQRTRRGVSISRNRYLPAP